MRWLERGLALRPGARSRGVDDAGRDRLVAARQLMTGTSCSPPATGHYEPGVFDLRSDPPRRDGGWPASAAGWRPARSQRASGRGRSWLVVAGRSAIEFEPVWPLQSGRPRAALLAPSAEPRPAADRRGDRDPGARHRPRLRASRAGLCADLPATSWPWTTPIAAQARHRRTSSPGRWSTAPAGCASTRPRRSPRPAVSPTRAAPRSLGQAWPRRASASLWPFPPTWCSTGPRTRPTSRATGPLRCPPMDCSKAEMEAAVLAAGGQAAGHPHRRLLLPLRPAQLRPGRRFEP